MSQDYRTKFGRKANKPNSVEIIENHKMQNSVTYKVYLEDHTIGDLLRIFLLKNDEVKFAGYKVPHPLEDTLEIKVQTKNKKPNEIVTTTLKSLQKDLFELGNDFDTLVKEKE